MKACLEFTDIVRLSQPQIQEMKRLGEASSSAQTVEACEAFNRQVRIVEAILIQNYGIAADITKRLEDLREIALVWGHMGSLCNDALTVLAQLRKAYPPCGTPELYDRVLDYKLACDKRRKNAQEEIECQKTALPASIFPKMI